MVILLNGEGQSSKVKEKTESELLYRKVEDCEVECRQDLKDGTRQTWPSSFFVKATFS